MDPPEPPDSGDAGPCGKCGEPYEDHVSWTDGRATLDRWQDGIAGGVSLRHPTYYLLCPGAVPDKDAVYEERDEEEAAQDARLDRWERERDER
jgi:hypothetical protein